MYPDAITPHTYWLVNMVLGTSPIHYDWDWGDGSPHDTIAFPSHTYAVGGFYPVCLSITDSTGCTSSTCHTAQLLRMSSQNETNSIVQVNVVASIPVSMNEKISMENIFVYPNPVSEKLEIRNWDTGKSAVVTIYNVLGEQVYMNENSRLPFVNCQFLPAGIFILKIDYGTKSFRTKFIKK